MRCPIPWSWVWQLVKRSDSGGRRLNRWHYRTADANAQTGVESPGRHSQRKTPLRYAAFRHCHSAIAFAEWQSIKHSVRSGSRTLAWTKVCATRLWFQIELPLEKRRRMPMTTVYFYEFIHTNMSALSAQRHVLGCFGADQGYLSMLCMGLGRAMAPRSSILLRAGRSVMLTSFWGSPARPTLAAARTTADAPEIGL